MSNLNNYFDNMRLFRGRANSVYQDFMREMKALDDYRGSKYYEEQSAVVRDKYSKKLLEARESAKAALVPVLDQMRLDAKKNVVTTPTDDMVKALTVLGMSDHLTMLELEMYSEQFKDCPLALKRLNEIARKHNMCVSEADDTKALVRIEQLDRAAGYYLLNYDGNENSLIKPYCQQIDRALREESYYKNTPDCKSCEEAEQLFLVDITHNTDRADFEPNSLRNAPAVKYHFDSIYDLITFMDKACEGEPATAHGSIKDAILRDSPNRYATAYKVYKETGEDIGLNEKKETA